MPFPNKDTQFPTGEKQVETARKGGIAIGIAFGLGFGWLFNSEMWIPLLGMMIGQYGLKFLLALIDIPVFYLLTRKKEIK